MKNYLLVLSAFISIPAFASYTTCDFDGWTFREDGIRVSYATNCFLSKPGDNLFCRNIIGRMANVSEGARNQHIPFAWHHSTKEICEKKSGVQARIDAGQAYKVKNVMGVKLYQFELDN